MTKKVVHIFRNLKIGGNQKNAKLIIASQIQDHYCVEIISTQNDLAMADEFEELGVKVTVISSNSSLKRVKAIKQFIIDHEFSIVYTWFFPFALRLDIPNIPFVHHVGTAPYFSLSKKWIIELIYLIIFRNARGLVVFASEHVRLSYKSAFLKSFRNYRVIYNGIDLENFTPKLQHSGTNNIRITMVGRLDGSKNFAGLIRLAARLKARGFKVTTNVVGSGTELPELKKIAKELDVVDEVQFLGERKDISEILFKSDIFVFLNRKLEGFGIVLIEAMAAGLPVVASNIGASKEIVLDGVNGYLIDDEAQLAERVITLIKQPNLRGKFGSAGRSLVKEKFHKTKMTTEYGKLDAIYCNNK